MPIKNGQEATNEIRMLPGGSNVWIISVSTNISSLEDLNKITTGMDGFVFKKPINRIALKSVMDSLANPRPDSSPLKLTTQSTALPSSSLALTPLSIGPVVTSPTVPAIKSPRAQNIFSSYDVFANSPSSSVLLSSPPSEMPPLDLKFGCTTRSPQGCFC